MQIVGIKTANILTVALLGKMQVSGGIDEKTSEKAQLSFLPVRFRGHAHFINGRCILGFYSQIYYSTAKPLIIIPTYVWIFGVLQANPLMKGTKEISLSYEKVWHNLYKYP